MRARRRSRAFFAVGIAFTTLGGFGVSLVGCLSAADRAPESNGCPTTEEFPLVSQLVERRCGTIDCHGQPGRSFRVYGRYGLRMPTSSPPPGYVPGGQEATTPDELAANYHSACGLEPEKMALVVEGKADVGTLTLVRKPRLTEAHKGGRVLPEGTDGDTCLTSWLKGSVDVGACDNDLLKP